MDRQTPVVDGLEKTAAIHRTVSYSGLPYSWLWPPTPRKEAQDAHKAAGMHGFMARPAQLAGLAAAQGALCLWPARGSDHGAYAGAPPPAGLYR